MPFTKEDLERFKKMLMYAVTTVSKNSDNHNGFSLHSLSFLLDELEQEGKIIKRPTTCGTHQSKHYYLKTKK